MNKRKKRRYLIIIVVIIILFFGPFAYFKNHVTIEVGNKSTKIQFGFMTQYGSKTKVEKHNFGFYLNQKALNLEDDKRIKVVNSSVLNLGLYSRITKEISFQRVVNNDTIYTQITAISKSWGLGKISVRKNAFKDILREIIDKEFKEI